MVKLYKRTDAVTLIKMRDSADAVMYLLDEQLKDAESDILNTPPASPDLRDRLVKVQCLRALAERLRVELK